MITFKEGNLRIPKWNRKVFIVAGGTTAYKKYFPEYKLEELAMMAFKQMLEDNDLKMDPMVSLLITFRINYSVRPKSTTIWGWSLFIIWVSKQEGLPEVQPSLLPRWQWLQVMPMWP